MSSRIHESAILKNITDVSFYNEAYSNYLEEVSNQWADYQLLVAEIIDTADPDVYIFGSRNHIRSMVLTKMEEHGYNQNCYIQVEDERMLMVEALTSVAWSSYIDQDDGTQPFEEEESLNPMFNALIAGSNLTVTDFLDSLPVVACSIDTTVAFLKASVGSTVADRLSKFNQYLSGRWNLMTSVAGENYNYFSSMLSTENINPSAALQTVYNAMGLDQLEEGKQLSETNFSKYTGASPVVAIDLSTTKKAVVSTLKVAATAIKAVWKGIVTVVKKVATKVASVVKETFRDPYDLYKAFDGKVACVDKFAIVQDSASAHYASNVSQINEWFVDHTYLFRTIFGDVEVTVTNAGELSGRYTFGQIAFKPLVIDWRVVQKAFDSEGITINPYNGQTTWDVIKRYSPGTYGIGVDKAISISKYIADNIDSLYPSLDSLTETEAYIGLCTSISMLNFFFERAKIEVEFGVDTDSDSDWSANTVNNFTKLGRVVSSPDDVTTNADFVRASAGYDVSNSSFISNVLGPSTDTISAYGSRVGVFGCILHMLLKQKLDRRDNPLDWTFVPYIQDYPDPWRPGCYDIKTDEENSDVASKVVAALVIVAAVAITVVIAKTASAKLSKKAMRKYTSRKAALNGKLARGETLTKKEWKQLRKSEKKLAKLQKVSAGSPGSSKSDETAPEPSVSEDNSFNQFDNIESLIHPINIQPE